MRFRIVGASCDVESMPGYQGDPCGDEIILYGGSTYEDVDSQAHQEGWKIVRLPGQTKMGQSYLCPKHLDLAPH